MGIENIDIQKLKYFLAVYEEGSITKAAEKCNISQPYLSSVIQHLENILGIDLFKRTSKGIIPTSNAHRFYKYVKKLISNYEETLNSFLLESFENVLTIGFIPTLKAELVCKIIKNLREKLKDTMLKIVEFQENCDLRIISDIYVDKEEMFIPLWREDMVLAVPLTSSISLGENITLEDLQKVPFIDRENCEYHEDFINLIRSKNLKLNFVAKVKSEETAVALVKSGLGVCILPKLSVLDCENIAMKKIKGMNCYRIVGIGIKTKNELVKKAAEVIINTVKEVLPKNSLIEKEQIDYGKCESE